MTEAEYGQLFSLRVVRFRASGVITPNVSALKKRFCSIPKSVFIAESAPKGVFPVRALYAAMKVYESQMNSHFLFNTLQLIQMMSVLGEEKKIPFVTKRLGDMLRFSLDVKTKVKFEEEIKNCENYFQILKMRYGDAFDYKIIVPDEILKKNCMKFMLQPFIENSITHGFHGKTGKWEICIFATVIWNNIVVIVKDNGNGINKEKLESIKASLASPEDKDSGLGIKNVYARIKAIYEESGGMEILSDKNGSQIMIYLPIEESGDK